MCGNPAYMTVRNPICMRGSELERKHICKRSLASDEGMHLGASKGHFRMIRVAQCILDTYLKFGKFQTWK